MHIWPEEYINRQTIMQRMDTQLKKLHAPKCSQVNSSIACTSQMVPSFWLLQARSNKSVPEPAFQNVAGPITNATDYCAMAVDSKNGFPNGGLSYSSIVPQPVFSPDNHPSIATCTDLDVLPNSFVSGWRSNPKASSKSVSSYFPQRQAYDCMFIWVMWFLKFQSIHVHLLFLFLQPCFYCFFLFSFASTIVIIYNVLLSFVWLLWQGRRFWWSMEIVLGLQWENSSNLNLQIWWPLRCLEVIFKSFRSSYCPKKPWRY